MACGNGCGGCQASLVGINLLWLQKSRVDKQLEDPPRASSKQLL